MLFERVIRSRKIAKRGENVVYWCANSPLRSHFGLSHGQRVLVVFCQGQTVSQLLHRHAPKLVELLRSASGRPKYVFQHAQASAHFTTP